MSVRLRYLTKIGPRATSPVGYDDTVSFLPMNALRDGEGGLSEHQVRPASEVMDGSYNYAEEGDLLLAKVTPCFENGKKAIALGLENGHAFATSEVHVLRPNLDCIDRQFLFYVLSSAPFRGEAIASMTGAGGLKRVSEAAVLNHRVAVTNIAEQRVIAAYLDRETGRVDALVERLKRLIALLTEKRQAVISRAVTKGLDSSAPMKDSGIDWLGEVPAHWEVIAFRHCMTAIEQGWSPDAEDRLKDNEEWGVLKSGCVNRGVFRPEQYKTLPADVDPRLNLTVRDGDVLMCRASGSLDLLGSVARVVDTPPRLMFSDKTYRFRFADRISCPDFVVFAFASRPLREQIELSVSGADGLANNISKDAVKNLWIAVPPINEQEEISNYLTDEQNKFGTKTKTLLRSIELARERRVALVSAAVTGQIPLSEMEAA